MNLLYITHKIPYPLSDGGKLRAFNQIKHLSKKHKIISLSFINSSKELKDIEELKRYCNVETVLMSNLGSLINSFIGLFSSKPLRVHYLKNSNFLKKAQKLTRWADLIIIQAPRMAQYSFDPDKTIIDMVDTPSLQISRAIKYENIFWRLIWSLELPRIKKLEKQICKKFKNIFVASKDDKKALGKGIIIKNGTQITNVKKRGPENNIMFLGNMEYKPNIDAVIYFIKEIFPIVKKKIADAKFYIVGKNPDKIKKFANKGITVTGFASDLGEYTSKCKVFVAPLRLGSGIQNKVLEALNYEIPVITTSIVNEGVEALPNKEIIIADDPIDFAKKTVELLKNNKLRKSLSKNGKQFLKKNYSWNKINADLDKVIDNI